MQLNYFNLTRFIFDRNFATTKEPNHEKKSNWAMSNVSYESHFPDVNDYPRRAAGSGVEKGFSMQMYAMNSELDYSCSRDSFQGYRIALHLPNEMPRLSGNAILAPYGYDTTIRVKAKKTSTKSKIKSYDIKYRQCFFPGEYPLKYFNDYTMANCEYECYTNYMHYKCGCIKFFMPRGNNETRICGIKDMDCYVDAENVWKDRTNVQFVDSSNIEIIHDIFQQTIPDLSNDAIMDKCNCIPFHTMASDDNDTILCGEKDDECRSEAYRELIQNIKFTFEQDSKYKNDDQLSVPCGCLPPCDNLKYTSTSASVRNYLDKHYVKKMVYE